MHIEYWTVSYWEENMESCKLFLYNQANWNSIPRLDCIPNFKLYEDKLVRFKCMVQDIRNPVFYCDQYGILDTTTNTKNHRSGKYRDFGVLKDNEQLITKLSTLKECQVVHCVNIPALNSWAKMSAVKCAILEKSDMDGAEVENTRLEKRSISQSQENLSHLNKMICLSQTSKSDKIEASGLNPEETLNLDAKCSVCIVNLYDVEPNCVKLNDIIEVVGFLSIAECNKNNDTDEENMDCEIATEADKNSGLPRIHAVACAPYMIKFPKMLPTDKEIVLKEAEAIREHLWVILSQVLAGDTLAADYMICHLISSVFSRCDTLVNGKFSVNLSNFPYTACNSSYVVMLYRLISLLVEKSSLYRVTIENLNTTTMVPKKDYDADSLVSGFLQLSLGTHLILDETKLDSGKLNDKGVRNVNALNSIIDAQRLSYDFQYYDVGFDTDIPILSLSIRKSILKSDCHLPMEAHLSCLNELDDIFVRVEKQLNDFSFISKLRTYLMIIREIKYELSDSLQQIIADDYVQMAKQNNATGDDLNRLLIIARLNCISRGKSILEEEDWKRACHMEKLRIDRLKTLNTFRT